jgi:ribosomal protein S18 acetylase RimI-like enzyme
MEMTTLQIRNAHTDELDLVSDLLRDAYLQYAEVMAADAWNSYLGDITNVRSRLEEAELIVAELDGRLVGAVTLYLKNSSSSVENWLPGWAGIRLLAVHPGYRGRGIGHALMEECLLRCRERGIKTIGLHTTSAMDVARRMYERMGFMRIPEYDFCPRPDVVVMAYRLDL